MKFASEKLFENSDIYKTENDKIEALWNKMGLYDGSYRKKM